VPNKKNTTESFKESESMKKPQSKVHSKWQVALAVLAVVVAARNALCAKDPLSFLLPNVLLFTPFRDAAVSAWDRVLTYDTTKEKEPVPIPEIEAKDFSIAALKLTTEGFRSPGANTLLSILRRRLIRRVCHTGPH